MPPTINADATQAIVTWVESILNSPTSDFERIQTIVKRLGAHRNSEGSAEIGMWAPELLDFEIPLSDIFLEILEPPAELDLTAPTQELNWQRYRLPMRQTGVYVWAVVDGLRAGTRDAIGHFYWVRYRDAAGNWQFITDYLAHSVPFGVLAPSEFYDWDKMQRERADLWHFEALDTLPDPDGMQRIQAPVNMLEIHPGTASREGTLQGLTRIYNTIAHKIRSGENLTAAEITYISYDAVQLMPIEPPIEHEAGPLFWETTADDPKADTVTILTRQHDIFDWGYDVMVAASPAINPAILSSKRPDELMDFIVALHNFPEKPIKVVFDIVYGHTDNQAVKVFPEQFLAGANMYGQNLNYLNLTTRAMLIEMMRRKHNYGVDGIRVDGAQDFKWWEPETDTMVHDDEFLTLMNNVVQSVNGTEYRPWMIFEDGRPWPRDDWELASTYREVTKKHPNVFQWGPLTFAHNTPFIFTFWIMKWWRILEMTHVGSRWITGCANHDTLRRGIQVDPKGKINTYLGESPLEIIMNAYDNPTGKLFDYAVMPGVPMDFLNASHRAPWGFIRNTDERYALKVVAEEANFTYWAITVERFAQAHQFTRLKSLGFDTLDKLARFVNTLDAVMQATADGDKQVVAKMLDAIEPPLAGKPYSAEMLQDFAKSWMADVFEYCNVTHYKHLLDIDRTLFFQAIRDFRRARPWLAENLRNDEMFAYKEPVDGSVVFYGLRRSPDGMEEVLFVANMEGAPCTLTPTELPIPDLPQVGWRVALATPRLVDCERATQRITLHDSEGIVFTRQI